MSCCESSAQSELHVIDEQQQHWFAGLPVTGSRTLTDEERTHVAWIVSDFTKKLRRSILVIAILAAIIATPTLFWPSEPASGRVFAFLLAFALVAGRRADLKNLRYGSWLLRLRRDAEEALVSVCSGVLAQVNGDIGDAVGGNPYLPRRADKPVRIEVLPRSALLWTRDGRRVSEMIAVRRAVSYRLSAAGFPRPSDNDPERL
jgi:hypothetical protein